MNLISAGSGWQWSTVKTRTILLVLITFVIGIWSLALYYSYVTRVEMQTLIGEQQSAAANYIAASVGDEFKERRSALELVANGIDAPLLDKPALVQNYLQQRPILQVLFNTGVFVTRLDGTSIAEMPLIGRVGLNYLDRDHIAAALLKGEATVGKPVVGKAVRAPSFALTVPIRDRHGKVIGAIAGITDLGKPGFLDQITESKYGQTGSYSLLSPKDRLIVTSSRKERVMAVLPARGNIPALDRMLDGYDGNYVVVNAVGSEVVNAARSVPIAGWRLLVSIPTEEAFAPIRGVQRRLLLAALIASLIAGALAWWLLRRQFGNVQLELENEELRQTRSALEAERARYFELYASAPVGYCNTDGQGQIERANQVADATLGATSGALLNRRISDFVSEEDKAAYDRLHRAAVNSDVAQSEELRMVRADGTRFWAALTATRYMEKDALEIRIILSDITAKVEQEQHRLRAEAAHRVALVREVHHRINNSLHGVIGLLGRFAETHPETSTPMRQAIGQVGAISVVHGLRGRGATGAIVLSELIRSIATEVQELWRTSVVLEISTKWHSLTVADDDAVSVAMILNELIVNAVKHGGLDHGRVEVNVRDGPRQGAVRILVSNRGQFPERLAPPDARHGGLGLITALIPRNGAHITRTQQGDTVVTTFELEPPVVCGLQSASTAA